MLTYTTAPIVEPGECITSAQWNALAAAFNDRLKGGVGDPTWRIWWRASALVRNWCAGEGAPVDDYWRYWNLADPRRGEEMPECQEGNQSLNPWTVFALGESSWFELDGESERVEIVPADPEASLHDLWTAAAQQRGAIAEDGSAVAPAWSGARSHEPIRYAGTLSPWLRGWGGYFGRPLSGWELGIIYPGEDLIWLDWEQCPCNTGNGRLVPTEYVFSPISEGLSKLTFRPTVPGLVDGHYCDTSVAGFGDNVQYVIYAPDEYILHHYDGHETRLSRADYVEGPYGSGGLLGWSDSHQLDAALQWFAEDFKGPASERAAEGWTAGAKGAPFDTFFGSQYPLAPSYGESNGIGGVDAVYPLFRAEEPEEDATLALEDSSTDHPIHDGYVLAGWYAKAEGLTGRCEIEVLDYSSDPPETLDFITLSADDSGQAEELRYLREGVAAPARIGFRVRNEPVWEAGGYVEIEIAELLEMKPEPCDAYLVLRMMSTTGEPGALDTAGADAANPAELVARFLRLGCITNDVSLPVQDKPENNPVFDTVRQFFSENLRFVDRDWAGASPTLVGYTVEDGKSVLRFRRYGYIGEQRYDMFRGIAPPDQPVESGAIRYKIKYVVRGTTGEAIYNGASYSPGETFDGALDASEFTTTGDTQVWQYDGILSEAPPAGWSNEWVVFLATHREGSGWCAPANYGEVLVLLHDRCTMLDPAFEYTGAWDIRDSIAFGGDGTVAENPSGYRYARSRANEWYSETRLNSGSPGPSEDFMRSCQIYTPDYEIESAVIDGTGNGDEDVVVITLSSRLRHNPAVDDFGDYGTGENGELTEAGNTPAARSDENAVMEYLIQQNGGRGCQELVGDAAYQASDTSACGGSCVPHFFFTRLLPKVWVDEPEDDEECDELDTLLSARILEWAHFVLAAICEGFVDKRMSDLAACPSGYLIDYRFERLCQEIASGMPYETVVSTLVGTTLSWDDDGGGHFAVQRRDQSLQWLPWITEATVTASPYTIADPSCQYRVVRVVRSRDYLLFTGESERPDAPRGWGPFSNTCAFADDFNQLAVGVNLLTTARIMLPLALQIRQATTNQDFAWSPTDTIDADPENCVDGEDCVVSFALGDSGEIPRAPIADEEDWTEWTTIYSPFEAHLEVLPATTEHEWYRCLLCDGSSYFARTTETKWQVRVDPSDSWLNCISEHIRDQFSAGPSVFLMSEETKTWRAAGGSEEYVCDAGEAHSGRFFTEHETTEYGCELVVASDGACILQTSDPVEGQILYWQMADIMHSYYCSSGPVCNRTFGVLSADLAITIPLT